MVWQVIFFCNVDILSILLEESGFKPSLSVGLLWWQSGMGTASLLPSRYRNSVSSLSLLWHLEEELTFWWVWKCQLPIWPPLIPLWLREIEMCHCCSLNSFIWNQGESMVAVFTLGGDKSPDSPLDPLLIHWRVRGRMSLYCLAIEYRLSLWSPLTPQAEEGIITPWKRWNSISLLESSLIPLQWKLAGGGGDCYSPTMVEIKIFCSAFVGRGGGWRCACGATCFSVLFCGLE